MRKRRILSLLLAVAVTATMLVAVPLTASAAESEETYNELEPIPTNIEYMSFAGTQPTSAPDYDVAPTPSPAIENIHMERFFIKSSEHLYSENKYLRGYKNGIEQGTNREITIDSQKYKFPQTLLVKADSSSDITGSNKVIALKTAAKCGITVYCSTDNPINAYDVETKKSIGEDVSKNEVGNNQYNAIYFYTEANKVIKLGGNGSGDTRICMIKFDWNAQPPAEITEVSVDIYNGPNKVEALDIYNGEPITLTAKVTLPKDKTDETVEWTHEGNITCQKEGNNITVTAKADSETATITATSKADKNQSATCTLTLHKSPRVAGENGDENSLEVPTKSETYDLLKTARETGGEGSGYEPYQKGYLYFDKHVAALGSNKGNAFTGKTSHDIDGNENNGQGIAIEQAKSMFAVKLNTGMTVQTMVTATGTNSDGSGRYGTISSESGYSGDLAKTIEFKKSGATYGLMSYTSTENNKVVYISATGGCAISQIQVIVPDSGTTFGDGTTDTGKYTDGGATKGVIRFLQEYLGDGSVDSFGMYFIDAKGDVSKAKIEGSGKLTNGIIADLYDIADQTPDTYSAMAYVVVDGETIWSKPINGSIADWNSVKEIKYDKPQE